MKPRAFSDSIRTEVLEFAEGMEEKLRKNDHRHHWRGFTIKQTYSLLIGEVLKLDDEVRCKLEDSDPFPALQRIREECYDIGNFAMMIADLCTLKLYRADERR